MAATLSISAQALIDSGSAGNFILGKLLCCLNLPQIHCQEALNIHAIMGNLLGKRIITHCSPPLTLSVSAGRIYRQHQPGTPVASSARPKQILEHWSDLFLGNFKLCLYVPKAYPS